MIGALAHRGPDDEGVWSDHEASVALGHRRLAVLDLSEAGHQPMVSACGSLSLVLNGEIYNHLELRQSLETLGAAPPWRGRSDTETLVVAIAHWGLEEALRRSVGMFALALWDRRTRTLSLAVDRMGEKPLYWGHAGKRFLFASEVRAIAMAADGNLQVDRDAVSDLVQCNYIQASRSIFCGIRKLPPGSMLQVIAGDSLVREASIRVWWRRPENEEDRIALSKARTPEQVVDELERLLQEAVSCQMLSDVPIGAFLSGGIDSATVVALMRAASNRPIDTFSIGFDEPHLNEAPYAAAIARHLGTRHHEHIVTDSQARSIVPQLSRIYSEPFADASAIPTALLCRIARRTVTVALSGDGGDELFAGYERYHQFRRLARIPPFARMGASRLLRVPPIGALNRVGRCFSRSLLAGDRLHKLGEVLAARGSPALYQAMLTHWQQPTLIVRGLEDRTARKHAVEDGKDLDPVQYAMHCDLADYLPGDILTKVDRAAMAVSLETRLPLLDHRVVDFALGLPTSVLLRHGQSKWPLRQVLYRHVPRELVDRPKMGFAVPLARWLRGPLREWAEDLLAEKKLEQSGILNAAPIRAAWNQHLSGERNMHYRLWSVLMFQAWYEDFQAMVAK